MTKQTETSDQVLAKIAEARTALSELGRRSADTRRALAVCLARAAEYKAKAALTTSPVEWAEHRKEQASSEASARKAQIEINKAEAGIARNTRLMRQHERTLEKMRAAEGDSPVTLNDVIAAIRSFRNRVASRYVSPKQGHADALAEAQARLAEFKVKKIQELKPEQYADVVIAFAA